MPKQHTISVSAINTIRNKKQAHITPLILAIIMIGACFALNVFTTIYANSIKSPMGSIFNQKEKEYDTISNHYYTMQNEYAYYNSTQLIRKKAVEELDMNVPKKSITIENNDHIDDSSLDL